MPSLSELSVDRYAAWRAWKVKWMDFFIVAELAKKTSKYQCVILRYIFADEIMYESLNLSETDSKDTAKVIQALKNNRCAKGLTN